MKAIKDILSEHISDMDDVNQWCQEQYESQFQPHFIHQKQLYIRLQDTQHPITDSELSLILMNIPLELFLVSEQISRMRTDLAVVKLKLKEKLVESEAKSTATTKAQRREDAELSCLSDQLLITAYESLIDRVEHEVSFSRELIMGAKKLWDARRRTEISNPVSEVNPDELPDYKPNAYIK